MKALGFGSPTGVQLPREASGRLRPFEDWEVTSLPHLAFGYEVSVTPLQLLNAYAAILNDGMLRRPRMIDAILSHDGKVVEKCEAESVRRVCSERTARNLRKLLIETVKSGTAKRAAIPGYEVGGKTGTAEKWDPERKCYPPHVYIVSFVGFVPAENPALLGVVLIDDPKVDPAKESGGFIAAPLFRRIASRVLAHLEVPPNPDLLAGRAALRH